jgi:ElaB/YqjD/DUF883 family membrane-anchored ribosome-binding protein
MSADPEPTRPSTVGMPGRTSAQIRRDIDAHRQDLGTSVEALRGRVTELTDWRRQVREHRTQLVAAAAAAGFLVGVLALRRRR